MADKDPVPEAVRHARHVHAIPSAALGEHDFGAAAIARDIEQAAFWAGMRQVIREEVAAVMQRPAPDQ
jgi:hypothetical protein